MRDMIELIEELKLTDREAIDILNGKNAIEAMARLDNDGT